MTAQAKKPRGDGRRTRADDASFKTRLPQIFVGLGCACAFLVVVLYRVPLGSIAPLLMRASPVWLGAAVCAYAANLALRAWRWQVILEPTAAVAYSAMARVLVVGYGLNTIMPLRLGELVRAEFLKNSCDVPRVPALTSIVIERMLDGLAVVACLGLGLVLAAHTHQPDALLLDLLAVSSVLFGIVLLGALCLGGHRIAGVFAAFPRVFRLVESVGEGFATLRTWRALAIALLTLILYVPEAASIWCVVKAVGLPLGFSDTLVLVGAASLSTLLPSGPGFLGTLQFAYVLAIGFAGGEAAIGVAAATLVQCCLLLPVSLLGVGLLFCGSSGIVRDLLAKRWAGGTTAAYARAGDDPAPIGPTI